MTRNRNTANAKFLTKDEKDSWAGAKRAGPEPRGGNPIPLSLRVHILEMRRPCRTHTIGLTAQVRGEDEEFSWVCKIHALVPFLESVDDCQISCGVAPRKRDHVGFGNPANGRKGPGMATVPTASPVRRFRDRIDHENGLVDRQIFSDLDVYKQELERIFARAWLFMCHESQIRRPGDFFQTYMGEEKVIVVRNKAGGVEVLLNACRHRGAAVCRAHSGNAQSFMCAYHGWTYDLGGNLIGVPGLNELYAKKLDRSAWGLRKAAHVEIYRGFIFATLDTEAPSLEYFLGPAGRQMIDRLADYGDIEVVPGIIRHRLSANWKIAMENDQDYYHVGITHASALSSWGMSRNNVNAGYWQDNKGDVILAEYGHVQDTMDGHYHANIFPHMCLFTDLLQAVVVRHPRGPMEIEQWYFSFIDKNAPEENRREALKRNISRLGPTGMIEQDDGENWEFCTKGAASTALREAPFNYQMGLGAGIMVADEEVGFPLLKDGPRTTEEYARWQLRCWAEWMDAETWPVLQDMHSVPAQQ